LKLSPDAFTARYQIVQLGGKGANLCEMAHLGLNVPPGMTITTAMCEEFQTCGGKLPEGLWDDVVAALKGVEEAFGKKFADQKTVCAKHVVCGCRSMTLATLDFSGRCLKLPTCAS
jgi:phosphoenolpyruvate synthase/pyruvate phosphate dikinase